MTIQILDIVSCCPNPCSSPPSSGFEPVSPICKLLGLTMITMWSHYGYEYAQKTGNKNGGNLRLSQKKKKKAFRNSILLILRSCSGAMVFRVACHHHREQFLPTCFKQLWGDFQSCKKLHLCKLWSGNLCSHKEEILLGHLEGRRLHISHLHPPTPLQLGVNPSCSWGSFYPHLPFTALWLRWSQKPLPRNMRNHRESGNVGSPPFLARDLPWLWAGHLVLHPDHKQWRFLWYCINL